MLLGSLGTGYAVNNGRLILIRMKRSEYLVSNTRIQFSYPAQPRSVSSSFQDCSNCPQHATNPKNGSFFRKTFGQVMGKL